MGTICTDEQVKGHRDLGCPLLVMPNGVILSRILRVVCPFGLNLLFEPGGLLIEVRACQLVVEMQRDVGQPFQGVKKALVKIGTVYRLDMLENIRDLIDPRFE